jgi:prefoldin subunit 5
MSVPKPSRVVRRSVAVALGIICIILIACLGGAMAYYTLAISDRDNTIASKNNQIDSLNSQISQLRSNVTSLRAWLDGNETLLSQTETWLNGNITYYNSQITNLQSQLNNFTKVILGLSDLSAEDNRTIPGTPYLQIKGTIHNFGITGGLATLYVKAYHNDGSVALETDRIPLSDFLGIDGQSSTSVDLNYYYNGSTLSSWTITVEEIYII